jgi:hypothetical protein
LTIAFPLAVQRAKLPPIDLIRLVSQSLIH